MEKFVNLRHSGGLFLNFLSAIYLVLICIKNKGNHKSHFKKQFNFKC